MLEHPAVSSQRRADEFLEDKDLLENECLNKYEGQEDVSTKCEHYKEASEAFIK